MGFLAEDRMLFRHEWGTPTYDEQLARARRADVDEERGSSSSMTVIDLGAAKKGTSSNQKNNPALYWIDNWILRQLYKLFNLHKRCIAGSIKQ
ncbi:uncharacterized protein TrAtP1_002625 [Trichoderma atroviride]|uniref:uncharacterized protein n=1 Tax=Hypocrea atroviridis TaxID=63577 RepID=UPI003334194E|nr:hypothetical protein TrAtP1_002625 [Trichoderma atroviride]